MIENLIVWIYFGMIPVIVIAVMVCYNLGFEWAKEFVETQNGLEPLGWMLMLMFWPLIVIGALIAGTVIFVLVVCFVISKIIADGISKIIGEPEEK